MKQILTAGIFLLTTFSLMAQTPQVQPARPVMKSRPGTNNPRVDLNTTPAWADNAVIYEVNLRQFTPSGTINEFSTHLERLSQMGVRILWFMPIQPIGIKNRKGSLGSYYSIQDYLSINPEHGTMDEWIAMVKKAHQLGMKVILDWVANHTAFDHAWTKTHPEWYTRDEKGNIKPPVDDWTDVADLNYDNEELRRNMIENMKFWLNATDIDGFRCDVAEMVPLSFWQECIRELRQTKLDIFMLAEGEKAELHDKAFDMTYAWGMLHPMNEIATGKKTAKVIDDYLKAQEAYPKEAHRMYFTSNHDENTWNGSNWDFMGDKSKTFAVLTYAFKGMPLIYTGQEADNRKRLRFFDKDTVDFSKLPLESFYTTLNRLKASEPALNSGKNGGSLTKISPAGDEQVFACIRKNDNSRVLFVINLSGKKVKFKAEHPDLEGEWFDVFGANDKVALTLKTKYSATLEPWSYQVYRIKKK